ncbi:S49 family peptidase [Candidatus Synechococcus calcipolaris G9]|uniref:S49 family peptidase n=1 Tax=Candidatus Synechococcus calcipolaris G9 TaxID=1497997 RepID=A0ABT6EX79_9SYNE|nr:S49 family peptidase [Candidatus Synechococcus calcipolaris]MDG2990417.1 S49 family peptidase [Candidatus Synechococcus calcipolaris G9]
MTKPSPSFFGSIVTRFTNTFVSTLSVFISLAFIGVGFTVLLGVLALLAGGGESQTSDRYEFISGKEGSRDRLLRLNISGPILGSPPENEDTFFSALGGVTYGYQVQKQLKEAAEEDSIKGVILDISTPGGTIFGSQAIFDGIQAYKEATGNPIYAFIEGISASGGVWAMVGADKIYADYGSMIGSIGIIGPSFMFYDRPIAMDDGLFGGGITTANGIEQKTIIAGRGKDVGNPFRRLTPEELQVFQAGLDQEYTVFVNHVAENRGMDANIIRNQMGAMIFGNQQAEQFKLIDGTLSRPATIDALAEAAGLGEDFAVVRVRSDRTPLVNQLFGVTTALPSLQEQQAWQKGQLCSLRHHRALAYYGDLSQCVPR